MNNIGYSTIYPVGNAGFLGPVGPTGATGATGTTGATGATGIDSNYITEIYTNNNGQLEFVFSDQTISVVDQIKGSTGIYAGLTAISLGNGLPIFKGICGGITMDFYNFRVDGLLGITYEQDGTLVFTIQSNNVGAGISASIENDRIVYLKSKNYVMTTDLIPQVSNIGNRVGETNYGYLNFNGEVAGRNVVADIKDSILSVGPIHRGEKIITLDNFYDIAEDGITLDVSRATVYHITTPIGIKGFKHDIIPTGSILSFTLVIDGDNVWNFPSDVQFDEESKPVFYPGTNILHIHKASSDSFWKANFTARGFGVDSINNPGVLGSCCYFDIDGTKHCEDYVTESYCIERNGTFAGSIPCEKNPCIIEGQQGEYDGICCSEGRCISDIDPNLCETIGGYFISGITCGAYGKYPDDNATNYGEDAGICYNKCKPSSICCKDGECLGQLTEPHCDLLGGKIVIANNCIDARCCDHIYAPSSCCKEVDGVYECTDVNTPYECKSIGGVYMGKNTSCASVNCDCIPPETIECYTCVRNASQTECECSTVVVTDGTSCESNGYYSTNEECSSSCSSYVCHRCNGSTCQRVISCKPCSQSNLLEGDCHTGTCNTKTCFKSCANCNCEFTTDNPADLDCPPDYPNESCDCDAICNQQIACFWCFPQSNNGVDLDPIYQRNLLLQRTQRQMQAPYRAMAFVNIDIKNKLDSMSDDSNAIELILPNLGTGSRTVVTDVIPVTLNGLSYKLPHFVESHGINPSYVSSSEIPTVFGLVNGNLSPISARGLFDCYYIGSYAYDSNHTQNNREKCLNRFGYENVPDKQNCKLCDFVEEFNYTIGTYTTDGNQTVNTKTVTSVEPYNSLKNVLANGPFPPLWGRMTYGYEYGTCGSFVSTRQTANIRLLSDNKIIEMCRAAFDGNLMGYMNSIVSKYKLNADNRHEVLSDMVNGMSTGLGSSSLLGPIVNRKRVQLDTCLQLPYVEYDPYLIGSNGQINYIITGGDYNQTGITGIYGINFKNKYWSTSSESNYIWETGAACGCFVAYDPNSDTVSASDAPPITNYVNTRKGWYLPYYSQRMCDLYQDIPPVYTQWFSEDTLKRLYPYYYPPKDSLINLTGEIYFNKPEDEEISETGEALTTLEIIPPITPGENGYVNIFHSPEDILREQTSEQQQYKGAPRGIFGRNLRYNLDEFRTASVFWHNTPSGLTQTMKYTELDGTLETNNANVSIPINFINGWFNPASDCYWAPSNSFCGNQSLDCGGGECNVTLGSVGGAGGGAGGQDNWVGGVGLIAPSTKPTQNQFATILNQTTSNYTTSKNVLIAEGICVNMLCPECNDYESC